MIIYNITANVSLEIVDKWNSDSGITYAIAYKCNSLQDLQKYEISFSKNLRVEYDLKFAQSAPTFRTIMEVLDEF